MDLVAAEDWIRARVGPVGPIETVHERPWATVLRVPLAESVAWFKACAPVQAFEPRLTAELFARWPDRIAEVLDHDEERAWLLVADAGTPIRMFGNPPDAWLVALPLCAELQRGEAERAHDHLAHGVPDLRVATLPAHYEDLLRRDLPLELDEIRRLREFGPRYVELCGELAEHDVPETIQHDDLHGANVYARGERLRLLDWGDAAIRTPSRPSLSPSGSSRRSTTCRRPTRGSRGCATPISSRGVAVSPAHSPSRSASARSRIRSHGCGSGTRCRRRHVQSSTGGSRLCCGAHSPRRWNERPIDQPTAPADRPGVAAPSRRKAVRALIEQHRSGRGCVKSDQPPIGPPQPRTSISGVWIDDLGDGPADHVTWPCGARCTCMPLGG